MAKFDNLKDVNDKFLYTVVLVGGRPVTVRACHEHPEKEGEFVITYATYNSRKHETILLSDPAFSYRDFNIGYCNAGAHAAWWFRKAHRQYQQGLKGQQMGWVVSTPGVGVGDGFGYSKPFIAMLENVYPDVEAVKKALMDGKVHAYAFHKDFALSYDHIHEDYILEYHGAKIGHAVSPDLSRFKILSEARHLMEALEEARRVHG